MTGGERRVEAGQTLGLHAGNPFMKGVGAADSRVTGGERRVEAGQTLGLQSGNHFVRGLYYFALSSKVDFGGTLLLCFK